MGAFLLTVVVLGLLIFAGYRLTLYLYSRGAVGVSSRQMQSVAREPSFIRPVRDVVLEGSRYGVHYARVGILMTAIVIIALMVVLVAVLASMR